MTFWVYAERETGGFKKVVYQIIGGIHKAVNNADVKAIVLRGGENLDYSSLFKAGADVIEISNKLLDEYSTELYANAISRAYEKEQPDTIFFGNTFEGRELAPRVASKLDVGMASDCTGLESRNADLVYTRPIFAGKIISEVTLLDNTPQIVTFRQNSLSIPEEIPVVSEEIKTIDVDLSEDERLTRTIELKASDTELLDVAEASIIISGGRGMKGPENFEMLKELAKLLNAAVGASRAAVDEGWMPQPHQVGQTGKTVSPELYIACGISGAIQHRAGMSSSKCIVAINIDEEADIFKIADFGIVDDLFKIIPILKKKLSE